MMQEGQFARDAFAVVGGEHLGALLSDLRGIEADQNATHFGASVPEGNVVFEITLAFEHRASDYPMDVDFAALDIFQDTVVGCGLATDVVVLGKTVDGDGDACAWEIHPSQRDGDHAAGDDEREEVHGAQGRKNPLSSRWRTRGSPPTKDTCMDRCLRTRSSTPLTSASPRKSLSWLRVLSPPR